MQPLSSTLSPDTDHWEIQRAIAQISRRFVGVTELDAALHATLADAGELTGADRAYLFLTRRDDPSLLDNTHEWCGPGVEPVRGQLQRVPAALFPWWMAHMRAGETLHVPDVAALPEEAGRERELLESQGVRSVLVFPVFAPDLVGFIGLDEVARAAAWSPDEIDLLGIAAEIVGQALALRFAREERERQQTAALLDAQRLESMALLASGAAHDLKNLLTVVTSYAYVLREEASGTARSDLGEIIEAARRATELSERLLGFGKRRGWGGSCQPAEALADLERLLPTTLPPGVIFETEVADDLPPVTIDRGVLDQVLMNLALNARDAVGERGRIRVTACLVADAPQVNRAGPWVRIDVADDGVGMPEHVAARIFDSLFTTKAHGTGLGLALAREAIARADGHLAVSSAPGRGTTLRILLPVAVTLPADAPDSLPPPRRDGERALVMIAEPVLRLLARRLLEEHGWIVDAVPDADTPTLSRSDVVVADSRLASQVRPGAPLVVVRGPSDPAPPEGAAGIPRPFSREHLLWAAHRAALRGRT